jgi:hypothetical protein
MATIIAQLLRSGRAWPELEFWEASATTTVSNIAGQCLPSIAAQGGLETKSPTKRSRRHCAKVG